MKITNNNFIREQRVDNNEEKDVRQQVLSWMQRITSDNNLIFNGLEFIDENRRPLCWKLTVTDANSKNERTKNLVYLFYEKTQEERGPYFEGYANNIIMRAINGERAPHGAVDTLS